MASYMDNAPKIPLLARIVMALAEPPYRWALKGYTPFYDHLFGVPPSRLEDETPDEASIKNSSSECDNGGGTR